MGTIFVYKEFLGPEEGTGGNRPPMREGFFRSQKFARAARASAGAYRDFRVASWYLAIRQRLGTTPHFSHAVCRGARSCRSYETAGARVSEQNGSNFSRLSLLMRALGSRNYRLFFEGQMVSLIGTWMTRVATSWLVYRLTHSPFLLGLTSFASQIPILFLTPFAGVWVDRWNRHRTLVVTQILSMLQSFALAALALSGVITVWEIIALVLMQGAINAFDMPARQSFVVQMIERREDLGNAIALNSSMVNGARLIGPAVAGILIAAVGEGYCFLIDGFSYIAVIASLLAMHVRAGAPAHAAARTSGGRVA